MPVHTRRSVHATSTKATPATGTELMIATGQAFTVLSATNDGRRKALRYLVRVLCAYGVVKSYNSFSA